MPSGAKSGNDGSFRKRASTLSQALSKLESGDKPRSRRSQLEAAGVCFSTSQPLVNRATQAATQQERVNADWTPPARYNSGGGSNSFTSPSPDASPIKTAPRRQAVDRKRLEHKLNQTLGAHYEFIVGELSQPNSNYDQTKMDFDSRLAKILANNIPASFASDAPKAKMGAAFTDRALRFREGRGAGEAFAPQEASGTPRRTPRGTPRETPQGSPSGTPRARSRETPRESGSRRPRKGDPPAGQTSIVGAKSPRSFRSTSAGQPLSKNFDSSAANSLLLHEHKQNSAADQDQLAHFLGRRGKLSEQSDQHANGGIKAAGDPDRVDSGMTDAIFPRTRGRQQFQGRSGTAPPRSGATLVMSPQPGDPPPPMQIVWQRKGDGQFALCNSLGTERHAVKSSPHMFRFADPTQHPPRARSAPPKTRDCAGVATGSALDRESLVHGGLGQRAQDRDKVLALNGVRNHSPSASFRSPSKNNSGSMAGLLSHAAGARDATLHTTLRMQADQSFADLVSSTKKMSHTTKNLARELRCHNSASNSSNLSALLKQST